MQNIAFDPKAVTVKVGQKVTWTNDDSVDHNVTVAVRRRPSSRKNFGKGATFSFTPDEGGHDQLRVHDPPGDEGDADRHRVSASRARAARSRAA